MFKIFSFKYFNQSNMVCLIFTNKLFKQYIYIKKKKAETDIILVPAISIHNFVKFFVILVLFIFIFHK